MGNACTINQMCTKTNPKHQQMMSFVLAKQIFHKDLALQQEVKDAHKSQLLIKVLQKIITYNNDNLIQHLTNQQNKNSILKFLECWSRLKLEQIDMMYQNILIRDLQVEDGVLKVFKQPKIIKKSNKQKIPQIFDHYIKKGKQLHQKQQVAFVIFTPEFDNEKHHQTLIKKLRNILIEISQTSHQNKCPIPLITIVTCASLYIKIKETVSKLCLNSQQCIIAVKKSNLIMDQLGRLCLKASNSPDLIQKSFGNDDFLNLHFQGESLLKIYHKKNLHYLVALELDYFTAKPVDYFLWGYFLQNFESFDSVYRCTAFNPKKDCHQIVVKQSLGKIYLKNRKEIDKQKTLFDWTELITSQSQIKWSGYFIFHLSSYKKILQNQTAIEIRDFVQLRKQKMSYWNPQTKSYQMNKDCTYFYKPLTNLFLRLEPNRACGVEYEFMDENQESRKKPSNFDTSL